MLCPKAGSDPLPLNPEEHKTGWKTNTTQIPENQLNRTSAKKNLIML